MYNRVLISTLLLLLGALIYATCRQEVLFLKLITPEFLETIRINIDSKNCNLFRYFIVYCLSDGLWYFALLTIQIHLCNNSTLGKTVLFCSIIAPLILELMQLIGVFSGTFDWLDIATYLSTFIIFILCQKKHFYQFLF